MVLQVPGDAKAETAGALDIPWGLMFPVCHHEDDPFQRQR